MTGIMDFFGKYIYWIVGGLFLLGGSYYLIKKGIIKMPKVLNSEKPLEEEANEISAGAGDVDQLNAVRTIVALGEDA